MSRVALIALLGACTVAPAGAGTLEVVDHFWGFDGRVVPGRINLLSLEIANRSAKPFECVLSLHRTDVVGRRLGAPLIAACFLSPGASRWVQFFPYVREDEDTWTIEWAGGPKGGCRLRTPAFGPPARVILRDPRDPLATRARVRVLSDRLFPPTVAATDGLDSLLIDYVPGWEPARRRALLDWLRRGGELHILHDRSGRYPVFPGELAVLNSPLDRTRVGAGLVVRHPLGRFEVSNEVLAEKGYGLPKLQESQQAIIQNVEATLFDRLSEMTRPDHNWLVIYLVSLSYIILIVPVNFVFGLQRRDYRFTLLFFLVAVAGSACLVIFFGRRGRGEAAAVNSIACARQLDADHYDVTQWISAFVVRGAAYDVTHDAPHNLYATCQQEEAVLGVIRNGKGGLFRVDMPLYSDRAFLHRGKLEGHHIKLRVVRWRGGEVLEELVLAPEPGFPADVGEMWALHRTQCYRLVLDGSRIRADTRTGRSTSRFFSESAFSACAHPYDRRRWLDEPREGSPGYPFFRLVRPLIARAIGGTGYFRYYLTRPVFARDRVQLFIFTRSPESFHTKGTPFGKTTGYALYHVDLFKPERSDG